MEHQHNDQELKLIVILKHGKAYGIFLLKCLPLIIGAALLAGGIVYYMESKKPRVYTASLKFMLAEDNANPGNPLSGMLGQFGLGGGNKASANLNKMKALLTTQKIIKTTMFEKVNINGKDDFLANHYIDIFNLHDTWKERKQDHLANFYFKSGDFEKFDRETNRISNFVYKQIASFTLNGDLEKGHLQSKFDDTGTEIVDLYFTSTSEIYSFNFLITLYKILSDFYISKTIVKQDDNFKMAKKRVDSLKSALASNQYQLASYKDKNRGIFKNQSRLKIDELDRESYRLQSLFAEAARNFEIAKMALQSKTPFITAIDMPHYPLGSKTGDPKWRPLKFGLPVGAFLMTAFLIAFKFFRDMYKKELEIVKERDNKSNRQQTVNQEEETV